MDYFIFLLAVLHVYKALGREMLWDTTVKLAKTMTLECMYPSLGNLTQMEWFKIGPVGKETMAIFNPDHGGIIREPYADRVHLLNSTLALNDVVLAFYNASEADIGFYSCLLDIFPHGSWEKVIQVVPPDSFEIALLSDSHVVSEPGQNVTLMYELQTMGLMQEVTWEKIQSHQIDLLVSCNLSHGRSYATRYWRQVLSNCSQGMRRTFIIMPHATASDSGLYRCSFKASTGENETFVIRLTVSDGGKTDKTNNRYVFFVAGGAVLLLLFVILIATIIILYNRRRRPKTVQFKKPEDTQNKASNNFRSPHSVNQVSEDAGEDIYVNYPAFSRRPKTRA
ncbi:CD226 antigen [Rhynchonycteris naso]